MTARQHNRLAVAFYALTVLDLVGASLFPPAAWPFWVGAAGFYVAAVTQRFLAGRAAARDLLAAQVRQNRVRALKP